MATSKPVVRQVDMEAPLHAGAALGGRDACFLALFGQADMLEFALTRTMQAPACLPGSGSSGRRPLRVRCYTFADFRWRFSAQI